MQALVEYLSRYAELTNEELTYLHANFRKNTFNKGDHLLQQGDVSRAFFFIVKGCVRLYYLVNGEEKTTFFYTENSFASSYESFTKQVPAAHSLQCVEDTELVSISFTAAFDILDKYPKFEFLARNIMEEELMVCQDVISSLVTLSPEQRYLRLMRKSPELIQRIPQYHLATYLGVTPESLSRIKKRLVEKGFS